MKRIQLFLITAAILAAGSAFTNVRTDGPEYVKVNDTWMLKSDAQQNIGDCQSGGTICTYTLLSGHQPNTESDFSTDPNENAQFVRY